MREGSLFVTYPEMIDAERAFFKDRPMRELRDAMLALSYHSWSNTLEEQARLAAIGDIVSERLARRMKERKA
jgi:hypothetical protein